MLPSKAELRREMRERLKALDPPAHARWSLAICEAIVRQPAYLQARTVALFDAMPDEPQVELLWELGSRRFVYPRVAGSALLLIEVANRAALPAATGTARFREPALVSEHVIEPARIDLILVPGLAFTRDGRRLGRGGGFYDRLLAQLPAACAKIGVCFALQQVGEISCEPHDMRVDAVVTEER